MTVFSILRLHSYGSDIKKGSFHIISIILVCGYNKNRWTDINIIYILLHKLRKAINNEL